jgi:hypothetical protein
LPTIWPSIAKTLEGAGHHPELVAGFLTRCLFSMFAEDVGLLPKENGKGAFTALLETLQAQPAAVRAAARRPVARDGQRRLLRRPARRRCRASTASCSSSPR